MNTLDDLRSTLDRRAGGLQDTEHHARTVAVRVRIRAVRRRRQAGVAAALAAVLVGGVAVTGSLRPADPVQPAHVVGIDVPERIAVLDFPYELEETIALGEGDHHKLSELDGERAITLVGNGLGDGSATLLSDGEPVARVRTGEALAAPFPVGGARPLLEVRYDGTPDGARAGVAVYEATGELAPGVTNGTAVFRESYAGQPILGAAFSEPGESTVEFRTDAAEIARVAMYCDGPGGLWVHVEVDGRPGVDEECGAGSSDAATGTSYTLDELGPGEHDVRVFLTRGATGPRVEEDGATVGAGLYAAEIGASRLFGQTFDHRIEYAGRTWVSDSANTSPLTISTSEDYLVGMVGRGDEVQLAWKGRLAQGESGFMASPDGGGHMIAGTLLAGDDYRVTIRGGEGRILLYMPE